jgi:hypothetical protein
MKCRCDADVTSRGPKVKAFRSGRWKVSRVISHYRKADEAYFWHWEDQAWQLVGNKLETAQI